MMECFQNAYAEMYDYVYAHKDYAGECDLIKQAFREYGCGEIKDIADWGCGTGNHGRCTGGRSPCTRHPPAAAPAAAASPLPIELTTAG